MFFSVHCSRWDAPCGTSKRGTASQAVSCSPQIPIRMMDLLPRTVPGICTSFRPPAQHTWESEPVRIVSPGEHLPRRRSYTAALSRLAKMLAEKESLLPQDSALSHPPPHPYKYMSFAARAAVV